MRDVRLRFRLVVGVTTMIAALGFATAYVATHDWFGRGDLAAMAIWSLPLSFAASGLMTALSARISRRSTGFAFAVLVPSGAILGVLWTLLAATILGGWILAFSFPVLLCWVAGGFLGGIAAALSIHPRSWPIAALLTLVGAVGILRIHTWASEPERAIRVVLKPMATEGEVDSVWINVLSRRTGRGDEHYFVPSINSNRRCPP
jgi:hypothetical protein